MKSIIFSLLAISILGLIATGFTKKQNNTHQILIQSTDSRLSPAEFSRSAEIITNRLKSFSAEKFEVSTIPGKNQIAVNLNGNWDLEIAANLVKQKGVFGFYETYNLKAVTELLKGDSMLLSLFDAGASGEPSSARIGCTTTDNISNVDKYLNAAGLNQQCRFAWDNLFLETEVCLYALRVGQGIGEIVGGADIESFNAGVDSTSQQNYVGFKFKKSAIQTWAGLTRRNINKAIAIVLDGCVIYAPVVREEIPGGNCQLTGGFTINQVKYIAAIGANGELPVNFKVVK